VPDGTRANALYVEGEPPRVQEFLQQVSTWAGQNRVEVTFDDAPAAEVDNLKQTQLRSQLVQGQGGGGPATKGPAGPGTPGPYGPVTGGSSGQARSAPVPAPGPPQPQPSPAPTRAVLLLFREQALSENKR
jgi:hypothetical protein